jgi:hypothetical protein
MDLTRRRVSGNYGTDNQPATHFLARGRFVVDGITCTPPWLRDSHEGGGGRGPMFMLRHDQPGMCGGWRWSPRGCPTSQALAIGWPSPVDGTVKDGVPSRHTP